MCEKVKDGLSHVEVCSAEEFTLVDIIRFYLERKHLNELFTFKVT